MSGTVREEVRKLATWAPLPSEPAWDDRRVDLETFERDIDRVQPPISDQERDLLLSLLDRPDEDSLYGLLNLIVTLLESAPNTGWELDLPTTHRPWFAYLRIRYMNSLGQDHDE